MVQSFNNNRGGGQVIYPSLVNVDAQNYSAWVGANPKVFRKNVEILGNPLEPFIGDPSKQKPAKKRYRMGLEEFSPAIRDLKVKNKNPLLIFDQKILKKVKITDLEKRISGSIAIGGHLGDSGWADSQQRIYGSGPYYMAFKFWLCHSVRFLALNAQRRADEISMGKNMKPVDFLPTLMDKVPVSGKPASRQMQNLPITIYRSSQAKVNGTFPLALAFGTRSCLFKEVWRTADMYEARGDQKVSTKYKTVPARIKEYCWHPLSLFIWYVDDGYWSITDNTFYISVGVSDKAVARLIEMLCVNFDINATIQKDPEGNKRLAIARDGSAERFHAFIYPWCQLMLREYPRVFSGERMFNKVIPPLTGEITRYSRFSSGPNRGGQLQTSIVGSVLDPFSHPWQPITQNSWMQTMKFGEAVKKLYLLQTDLP